MNQREAEELCARHAAEHPDRETHHWIPRADDQGGWSVVKIGLPPVSEPKLTTEPGGDEAPPTADDPRQSLRRNVPPFGA